MIESLKNLSLPKVISTLLRVHYRHLPINPFHGGLQKVKG